MIESIKIEDIKDILSKFRISINENEDGTITFIDNDSNEEMKAELICNPGFLISPSDVKPLTSLDKMINTVNYVYLYSKNRILRYRLRDSAQKGKWFKSLYEFGYQNNRPDGFIEYTQARFERAPNRDGEMSINTILFHKDHPLDITSRKNIEVCGNGSIHFDLNNRDGFLENGNFIDGWYLEENEIKEELNSNELITIFAECYGKQYPKMIETIQTAMEFAKGTNK